MVSSICDIGDAHRGKEILMMKYNIITECLFSIYYLLLCYNRYSLVTQPFRTNLHPSACGIVIETNLCFALAVGFYIRIPIQGTAKINITGHTVAVVYMIELFHL